MTRVLLSLGSVVRVLLAGNRVTVVGRNFIDTRMLRCLFWREGGSDGVRQWDDWQHEVPATFVSSTRVECLAPPYPWWKCSPLAGQTCRYTAQQNKYDQEAEEVRAGQVVSGNHRPSHPPRRRAPRLTSH